jgi:hypothetical protein
MFLQNLGPRFINEKLHIKNYQLVKLISNALTPTYFALIFDYFKPTIEKLSVKDLPQLLWALNGSGSNGEVNRRIGAEIHKRHYHEIEWHPELMKKTIFCLQEKILAFFENTADASQNMGALMVSQSNALPLSMSRLAALVPFLQQTTISQIPTAIIDFLDRIGDKSFTFLIQTVPEVFRRLLTLPIDATLFIKKLDLTLLVTDQSTLQNIACMVAAHLVQYFSKNFHYSSTMTSACHYFSGVQSRDCKLMNIFKTILDSSQENSEKCAALLDAYYAQKASISADLSGLFEKYSFLLLLDKIIKPYEMERCSKI